ncbi:cytochrome p450 [Moniliophthora roreri MCA 2997]|uniref:Cytochrome p450 n=2 Tax=Moniliophthora roreri TaxID=221103 RepID=V2X6T1_MONRO|nr:cytochrome p450 [Moniliophthora roreri MCA 2997]KAI3614873.1 cytochrome p450 [Moniliophthora roreri]
MNIFSAALNVTLKLTGVAALSGVATHQLFRTSEPTRHTFLPYLLLLALGPTGLCFSFNTLDTLSLAISYVTFYTFLITAVIAYRLSPYHPLAEIPGPTMFKVSKLWRAYICWKGQQHHMLKALHDEYGTVVRTGPNEISVIDVDSIKAVLGPNGLPKGQGYQVRRDERTEGSLLELVGDPHTARRRMWNRGMSSESLREYEDIIYRHATQLVEGLASRSQVDLGRWLGYFSIDFMADMAFGAGNSGPQMLLNGQDKHGLIGLIEIAAKTSEILTHIPWLRFFPGYQAVLAHNVQKMLDFGRSWSSARVANGARTKDLWYHLTDEAGLEKSPPSLETVTSDSALAIVAGSDTTASAMTSLFWFLLANPEWYKRLQNEVDEVYPDGDDALDASRHGRMKILGACIDECLRLMPPVPTGGPRTVVEAREIAGHFLPQGTQVYVPVYCVHRRAYHFYPNTDDFDPSRWLVDPNFNPTSNAPSYTPSSPVIIDSPLSPSTPVSPSASVYSPPQILDYEAYIPFSYGPANCVGKNLARREMMMVISLLMQKYEFRFKEGFEWEDWPEKAKDYFVALRAPLEVDVRARRR